MPIGISEPAGFVRSMRFAYISFRGRAAKVFWHLIQLTYWGVTQEGSHTESV
jgi:hypothetical protein